MGTTSSRCCIMSDEVSSVYRIKLFTGDPDDWPLFNMKFQSVCSRRGCLAAIKKGAAARPVVVAGSEDETTQKTAQKEWDEASEKVFTELSTYVAGLAAEIVAKYSATRDVVSAYREFEDKFELTGEDQINLLQEKFYAATITDGEDPDKLFTTLDAIGMRLEQLSVPVAESAKKAAAMRALPAAYGPLKTVIRTNPGMGYNDFKMRVRVFIVRRFLTGRRLVRPCSRSSAGSVSSAISTGIARRSAPRTRSLEVAQASGRASRRSSMAIAISAASTGIARETAGSRSMRKPILLVLLLRTRRP